MKYSRQRELILETLRKAENHPTAEEIHALVKEQMHHVSLGTVYRNLNQLTEMGMVRKLETAGSTSIRYDGRNDEHCHLICTSCGSISDVDIDSLETLDSAMKHHAGFVVHQHEIVLKGLCSRCAQSRKE